MDKLQKLLALEQEADNFGFNWDSPQQIMDQIKSECEEINEHLNDNSIQNASPELKAEIADLLHGVISLCAFCRFNPNEIADKAIQKFERRFSAVKEITKEKGFKNLKDSNLDEMMKIWNEAKKRVG